MNQMKMEWVPYIPFEHSDRQFDRMDFQIFSLVCKLTRDAFRHMNEDDVKKFHHCLPYFYQPFEEDELEQNTLVEISFPSEPPVECDFDWEFNKLEEFVDRLIEEGTLSAEQKNEFKSNWNSEEDDEVCWIQPSYVPECLLFHLKTFEWRAYGGSKEEKEVAMYILKNARQLVTATVRPDPFRVRNQVFDELEFATWDSRAFVSVQWGEM